MSCLEDVRSDHDARGQLARFLQLLVGHELLGGGKVLDRGDPALARFFQDRAHLHEMLLERDGRDDLLHEIHGIALENTGEPPARVLLELAAFRRRRRLVDPRELQREGVREVHAAIEAAHEHGMIRRHRIDEAPIRCEGTGALTRRGCFAARARLPLLVGAPHAAGDPASLGEALRRPLDAFAKRLRFVHVEEVHSREERSRAVDVNVGIIEPGRSECSCEIDLSRRRFLEASNLLVRPHGENAIALHGERLRPGPGRLESVDPAIHENDVGCVLSSSSGCDAENEGDDEGAHVDPPAASVNRVAGGGKFE